NSFTYFFSHFGRIKSILLEAENQYLIISSLKLLANIYLYNFRRGSIARLTVADISFIIEKYEEIDDSLLKISFFDGLSWLLLEFEHHMTEWIDFFTHTYQGSEDIGLKSQILRLLAHFPKNKDFELMARKKYIEFFNTQLEYVLQNVDDTPPDSILYIPNIVRDILDNVEQLSFYYPLIVEEVLTLYEEVFRKFVPELRDNRPGFMGMAWQRIHSIYYNIINYYKNELDSEKLIFYFEKASGYAFSNKEKIELNINIKTNGTIIKKIVLPVRLQSVSLNNKGIKLYAVIIINLDVVDRILLKNFEFRRTKKVIRNGFK
ncbi:hypothetical protein LCGC14_1927910, partial [marine sediment metagenome]